MQRKNEWPRPDKKEEISTGEGIVVFAQGTAKKKRSETINRKEQQRAYVFIGRGMGRNVLIPPDPS